MDIFTTPTTRYHKNGRLAFESRHYGDLVIVNEWWPNGKKLRECVRNIKTLAFVGMRREYDGDGNIEIELPYNNEGKADGVQKGFYPDGRLAYEMFYENGKLIRKVEYFTD